MNISLTLEFHKCKGGTDIERNCEFVEEISLLASIGNENLDCSDKGKHSFLTLPP